MSGSATLRRRSSGLHGRAHIIQAVRHYFIDGGYLEVETPLRIPAPAPESNIDAVASGRWFLQTSPEICMKRMLASGYERLFQISRCWREGERGNFHLPEFTMLEWYRTGGDYRDLMDDCEELIRSVSNEIKQGYTLKSRGRKVSLASGWERLSVREAFLRYTPLSMEAALQQEMFDELMVRDIEPHLGLDKPTFLLDYPAERAALSRLKPDDPSLSERFELYIAGIELANGFSELTDAKEQLTRFAEEAAFRSARGKQPYPMPDKFLDELPSMPPSAGIALGIDRLVMVLLDCKTIDDVVAFTPEEL